MAKTKQQVASLAVFQAGAQADLPDHSPPKEHRTAAPSQAPMPVTVLVPMHAAQPWIFWLQLWAQRSSPWQALVWPTSACLLAGPAQAWQPILSGRRFMDECSKWLLPQSMSRCRQQHARSPRVTAGSFAGFCAAHELRPSPAHSKAHLPLSAGLQLAELVAGHHGGWHGHQQV